MRPRLRRWRDDDDPAPLPRGSELLPGYVVLERIAVGRRLETYDAWDLDRDCRCIVKLVRADRRDEADVIEGLRSEGEIVTTLAHPHLLRGFLLSDDPPAVVLELLTGSTLAATIDEGRLTVPDCATLGLQLTSVLGYLHRHNWLHLDVKPANVIVQDGRAILIDLSLAGHPGTGRSGAGTRGYIAPEQAIGRGLAPATDVFALGITMWEALTEEMPYGDESTWDSRRRLPVIHRSLPRDPGALPDDVPPDFADLLRACLDLDPASRPRLADCRAVLGQYGDTVAPDLRPAG